MKHLNILPRIIFVMMLLIPVVSLTKSTNAAGVYIAPRTENPGPFLYWPLNGPNQDNITRLPDSGWTHHFLGISGCGTYPSLIDPGYWYDGIYYSGNRNLILPRIPDAQVKWMNNGDGGVWDNAFACYAGHEGTDISQANGTHVLAAASGYIHSISGSRYTIRHENVNSSSQTWYTTYVHVTDMRFSVGAHVDQGEWIANVGSGHLHFEVQFNGISLGNRRNPYGIDFAPYNGCLWIDSRLCPISDSNTKRIAVLDTSGRLMVKEGGLDAEWVYETNAIRAFQLAGNRIAVVDSGGNLMVKEGGLDAEWVYETNAIRAFQLAGNRIAVVDSGGNLMVKEGGLDAEWVYETNAIRAFQLAGNRIAVVDSGGNLMVKEGGLDAEWVYETNAIRAFQLAGNRIAVVDSGGNLMVKEGGLDAEWICETGDIRAFQLEDNRIAVVDSGGNLMVKEGGLDAEWVYETNAIRAFQLAGNRIAIADGGNRLIVKEGNLYAEWIEVLPGGMRSFQLDGTLPVSLTPSTFAIVQLNGGTLTSLPDATSYVFSYGSFADTTVVTHTIPYLKDIPFSGSLIGIEHAFEITATNTTTGQIVQPVKPYTITIHYSNSERRAAIEDTLALYGWNGSQWVKENSSVVDVVGETITATPNHFSLWAVLGETKRLYLPLIMR